MHRECDIKYDKLREDQERKSKEISKLEAENDLLRKQVKDQQNQNQLLSKSLGEENSKLKVENNSLRRQVLEQQNQIRSQKDDIDNMRRTGSQTSRKSGIRGLFGCFGAGSVTIYFTL